MDKASFKRVMHIGLGALLLAASLTVRAQQVPRPNAIVSLYNDADKSIRFAAFSPGNSQPRKLFDLPQGLYAEFSPDGQFYTAFGMEQSSNQPQNFFGRVGQTAHTPIPIDNGYTFTSGKFSPDGKYFAFALSQQPSDNGAATAQLNWVIGLLDVTNNQLTHFSGPIVMPTDASGKAVPKPASGFYFAPMPAAWSPDSSRLFISLYLPFSDGGPSEMYVIDLSGVKGKPGNQPLPLAQPLPRVGIPQFALTLLSPDTSKIAYVFNDPKRIVPNYQGMFEAPNTISIQDIATGKQVASVQAPQNQAIGFNPTWSADSSQFFYVAGAYQSDSNGLSTMVNPLIYSLSSSGAPNPNGLALVTPQDGEVQNLLGCSDSLFFATVKNAANGSTFTIYSAPLTDLKTRSKPLVSSTAYVQLMGCTQ